MRISGTQVRKVILLKKTVTKNDFNEDIIAWAADITKFANGEFCAEWWDQGGKEGLKDGQLAASKDIRAKCRYITGLNEADYRIRKDDLDYDIESIKEIGRNEGQMLILKRFDNE